MHRIIFPILLVLHLFSYCDSKAVAQENNGQIIYVDQPRLATDICTFADKGRLSSDIRPYAVNGRVYFFLLAFPLRPGNLHAGYSFNIDIADKDYFLNPRILAVYQGPPEGSIEKDNLLVPVVGYAEKGSIIITRVFYKFDLSEIKAWLETVKTSSQQAINTRSFL